MAVFKSSFILALLFLISTPLLASDLVNVEWLKENANSSKIIDLRSAEQFQTGHIPHAINIPYSRFTRKKNNVDGFVETPIVFKSLMEEFGIKNSDLIVLYSDWSFLDSMRIYWVMDFYGHQNKKVLDGGLQAWLDKKYDMGMQTASIKKSQYVIEVNSKIMTTKFRTYMASKNSDYVIIDGRDSHQFNGEISLTGRKGHIPNAINIPWLELINNRRESDGFKRIKAPSTLKDIKTLEKKLSQIPKDKKIILYCNGGQESSVLYFALKELGINASLYDGSWFEWSNDNNLPIADNL